MSNLASGVFRRRARLEYVSQWGFLRFCVPFTGLLSSEAIDSHRQQLLSSRSLVIELVPTNNGLEIYNTSTAPSQREEHYAHHRPQRRDVVRRRAELNDVRVDAARSFHAIEQTQSNVASNARDGHDHTRRCGGCSGAITRILTKVDGVNKVEPDLETQKVTVDVADGSGIDGEALLEKLAAWANSAGKKVPWRRDDDRRGSM